MAVSILCPYVRRGAPSTTEPFWYYQVLIWEAITSLQNHAFAVRAGYMNMKFRAGPNANHQNDANAIRS